MPRKIFRPNGDEITGDVMRYHNEECNDLYLSSDTFV